MNLLQVALIAAVTAGIILANVYSLHVKRLLRARGYPSSLFDQFSDFSYLAQAIAAETDSRKRDFLVRLRTKLKLSLLVSLALFVLFGATLILWPVSLR